MAEPATRILPDFWRSSGFHLLRRDAAGHLAVTDDLLVAYLERPELSPAEESSAAERALHDKLRAAPRAAIADAELDALADPDARDNYRLFRGFRDRLVAAGTIEAAYLALFKAANVAIPPLFVDHLVHAILRNILDDCDDPIALRAAELLFRSQKASLGDGAVMLADEEAVEIMAQTGGFGAIGHLLIENATPLREVVLDVLSPANAEAYWQRSDRFDTVLDFSFGRGGQEALCRVLEAWVAHLLGIRLSIEPVRQIRDQHWSWHVGLDVESSSILNALYLGQEVDAARLGHLAALFRAGFRDPADMRPDLAGKPVYLGLAVDAALRLRLKPQNLLLNLPLARQS
jgi:hypothetical protein